MTLLEYLQKYTKQNAIPMHMPGHKRKGELAPYLQQLCAGCDLTEINNMDDLYAPTGILKECQQRAQELWHSSNSYFLVNGSTCGILAGIRACTGCGDRILVDRNCHKSVYNAIELCKLSPVYILPQMLEDVPVYADIDTNEVKKTLEINNDIKLIVLTSPTYEGVISDIKAIADLAHSYGIPVLVDEAHGAHLNLSAYFTGGAVAAGADVVVQSLHKTLPSLTQTAVLHLNSQLVSPKNIQRQIAVFQTSSPSYLLMSSIDSCVDLLSNNPGLFENWYNNLEYFKKLIKPLKHLSVLNYTGRCAKLYGFDKSKIVISTAGTSISGKKLMDILRSEYNIELEMCCGDYAIAMTGIADSKNDFAHLANALLSIDKAVLKNNRTSVFTAITKLPQERLNIAAASNVSRTEVPIAESVGKTCGEYVWIYPPGVPIITPGEIINTETVDIIESAVKNKMNLQKTVTESSCCIAVIKEN